MAQSLAMHEMLALVTVILSVHVLAIDADCEASSPQGQNLEFGDVQSYSHVSLLQSSLSVQRHFPIDFVYCWSGAALQQDPQRMKKNGVKTFAGKEDHHNAGLGFGELRYSIQFLEAYAPWFNKIYILVNNPVERPAWLSEASMEKIVMIDRCTLFSRSQDCPTKNDAACRAVMHKIPGLSEHFVSLDDDMLVVNPSSPSDFFTSEGRPLVFVKSAEVGVAMYAHRPPGPDMPPASVPTRMSEFVHTPYPALVSFAETFEHAYPDWFDFVRSHTIRFTCCNASDGGHWYDLEEDFQRIYPHMLLKMKVGIQHTTKYADCQSDNLACLTQHLQDPQLRLLAMNNIDDVDNWSAAQDALKKHLQGMPPSKFVVNS